ncbi:hypothetical protein HK104_002705, partial [Borealophlyctis nickersoniae]
HSQTLFAYINMGDYDRILTAAAHLTGTADIWWGSQDQTTIATWAAFETALKKQFSPVNTVQVARHKLANIRQTKSVQDYQEHFQQLLLQIPDISDSEKVDRFIRALKPNVHLQVNLVTSVYTGTKEITFAWICELAGTADTVLFNSTTNNRPSQPRGPTINGPVPMDIDTVTTDNKPQKLTDKASEWLRKNKGCFFCRKPNVDHTAKNCPEKLKAASVTITKPNATNTTATSQSGNASTQ